MFEWKDTYSIGIETIDDQHKGLLEIGNRLEDMNISDLKEDNYIEILVILNELLIYSRDHFQAEEAYMASINYPHLDQHCIRHNKFIDYVASIDIQDESINQELIIKDLFVFIEKWIINHILKDDLMISQYALAAFQA